MASRAAVIIQDPTVPEGPVAFMQFWGFWVERTKLAFFELGVPLLAALALTRPRTKTYFEEVAAAADGAEEEP